MEKAGVALNDGCVINGCPYERGKGILDGGNHASRGTNRGPQFVKGKQIGGGRKGLFRVH